MQCSGQASRRPGRQPLSLPSCCPGCTLWDQHVGQDGEASHSQGAGQGRVAAKESEHERGGDPGPEAHGSKEDLEEEDVAPQVLQAEDQPIVGEGEGQAVGRIQKPGPCPMEERAPLHHHLRRGCTRRAAPAQTPGQPGECRMHLPGVRLSQERVGRAVAPSIPRVGLGC